MSGVSSYQGRLRLQTTFTRPRSRALSCCCLPLGTHHLSAASTKWMPWYRPTYQTAITTKQKVTGRLRKVTGQLRKVDRRDTPYSAATGHVPPLSAAMRHAWGFHPRHNASTPCPHSRLNTDGRPRRTRSREWVPPGSGVGLKFAVVRGNRIDAEFLADMGELFRIRDTRVGHHSAQRRQARLGENQPWKVARGIKPHEAPREQPLRRPAAALACRLRDPRARS